MRRPAIADYPPGARAAPRVIDGYELVWLLRGRAEFTAGGDTVPLAPGWLLLIPPGLRHGFDWDRGCRHGFIHFGLEDAGTTLPQQIRLVRMTRDDPLAGMCAYLLWLGTGEQPGWHDHAVRALRFLLALMLRAPLPTDRELAPPALGVAVEHLRRWWSAPPLRRVPVDELAAAAGVSRGYLNRLFRNDFGLSVGIALEHVRCARAEVLLTRTDLPIEAVAQQCGFADASHFTHRFTIVYGIPPSAYRTAGQHITSLLEHPGVRRLSRLLWD